MRNLAIRLVLWLCDRYGIDMLAESRIRNGSDAVARGKRYEEFATEEGGLYDMIDERRREAFCAYGETAPGDVATRDYLAMQDRCWTQLRACIVSVVQSGKIAEDKIRRIERENIARMGNLRR